MKTTTDLISADMKKSFKEAYEVHTIWHKFYKWLEKTFATPDMYHKARTMKIGKKKIKIGKHIDEYKLSQKLVGYECMKRIEKYVKYNPQIKIIHCDDSVYAGSDILLGNYPF